MQVGLELLSFFLSINANTVIHVDRTRIIIFFLSIDANTVNFTAENIK